ncbi:MAG TPA: alpha/beta hydrolase [Gaiellaceae bacterium]
MTVLLLHAFPLDGRMWEPQLPALSAYDVHVPLLYGRGPTMTSWAESIAGEIEGELVVVGASMGGYCALALAAQERQRVRGLLLLGARPDADSDERRAGRADTIALIEAEGADGLWRMMLPKLVSDQSKLDQSLEFRETDKLVQAMEAVRDRADSTEVARSLEVPVQFVVGDSDPYVSASELDGFEVLELSDTGHLANLERPDEFNAVLSDFLGRV